MTFDEANAITEKRLCPICMGELEKAGYFVRPTQAQQRNPHFDRWEAGICDDCGKRQRATKRRWLLPKYEWFKERGLV